MLTLYIPIDIYGKTGDFAFYPLELTASLALESQVLDTSTKIATRYFYLERSKDDASIAIMVPKPVRYGTFHDPAMQLFHSLPVGFVAARRTYLFDSDRACVYILGELDYYEGLVSESVTHTYARTNKVTTMEPL